MSTLYPKSYRSAIGNYVNAAARQLQINASYAQLLGLRGQELNSPDPIRVGSVQVVVARVEFGPYHLDHSPPNLVGHRLRHGA